MAEDKKTHRSVITVGAGPSALSAAVYTTREDIDTLLIEKGVIGGLAAITDMVDNYPGFSEGVTGMHLAEELRKQAERFGAEIELGEVQSIERDGDVVKLGTTSGDYTADAVLIATGSDYRKLGVPGEEEFYGRGVHFCATCDGAFYRDKKLIVVGGGNSAAQEALFLTRFATEIEVYIRGDAWKASDVLVQKVNEHEKISVHFNTEVKEIRGDGPLVTNVLAINNKTNEETEVKTDGVFIFVGLLPNTTFLQETAVELDDLGLVKTNSDLMTAIEGVFASGDVRSGATMQIASAVGEGATAALKIREYLEAKEDQAS